MPSSAYLGVSVILTVLAGFALLSPTTVARARGWKMWEIRRPGGFALVAGVALSLGATWSFSGHLFVMVAAVVGLLSGLPALRKGGRTSSFLLLWLGAIAVVAALDHQLPITGVVAADVILTALLLAGLCSTLRELDAAGSSGWSIGLVLAAALTGLGAVRDATGDTRFALLVLGALVGIVALVPFESGMLGRVGVRFLGLVVGGIAIRVSEGSPLAATVITGIGVLGLLTWLFTAERRYRGWIAGGVAAGVIVLGALAVPATLALAKVYRPLRDAAAVSRSVLSRGSATDLPGASAKLQTAEARFRSAAQRLDRRSVRLGLLVPFFAPNLRATSQLAHSATELSASARALIDSIKIKDIAVVDGQVPLDQLDRLAVGLDRVRADVGLASTRFNHESLDLLAPPLRDNALDLRRQLDKTLKRIELNRRGVRTAQLLLGARGPKRFFVAVGNNAESRATGGYVANYGILVADRGRVTLEQFHRTTDFAAAQTTHPRTLHADEDFVRRYSRFDVAREWTNVNMSPDFPTVGAIMADQYAQFSGTRVDGIIGIDPIGLAAFMRLTGPVHVAGWPVPLTADNLVPVTLHDEYIAFDGEKDQRIDFLGKVASEVFNTLSAHGFEHLGAVGSIFTQVTHERHLQVWTRDRASQRFFAAIGADGATPRSPSDSLLVTTQNAAGNKLDYYLRRSITYDASIAPAGAHAASVKATVRVELTNTAPAGGEPRYVIGPYDSRFIAGQNHVFFTLYSPLTVTKASLDGKPLAIDAATELGRIAYSAFVDIPAGTTRTVEVELHGTVARIDGRYALDAIAQPLVSADAFHAILRTGGPANVVDEKRTLAEDAHFTAKIPR